MAAILDSLCSPITGDLLFYLHLYYILSSDFALFLSYGSQESPRFAFLALVSWQTATDAHHSLAWTGRCEVGCCLMGCPPREKKGEISESPCLATFPKLSYHTHPSPLLHGHTQT